VRCLVCPMLFPLYPSHFLSCFLQPGADGMGEPSVLADEYLGVRQRVSDPHCISLGSRAVTS